MRRACEMNRRPFFRECMGISEPVFDHSRSFVFFKDLGKTLQARIRSREAILAPVLEPAAPTGHSTDAL
jgi:hypothetical protein